MSVESRYNEAVVNDDLSHRYLAELLEADRQRDKHLRRDLIDEDYSRDWVFAGLLQPIETVTPTTSDQETLEAQT